ncbi:MAG: aminotransferase class I/II-fold pyridoxal phosphate-dependent enzyme [Anaerolineales bacterium]|nr:aminotransferase class I/II-fold pyridoxal phosphate-dependent enzyme [Anaerolineales bacterium]
MSYLANRVANFGTTIFTEMTNMAVANNAVNLGQGFPDFAAPAFIKEAARQAIADDINQYAPAAGRPRLRQAIARQMERQYGLKVDPDNQIQVMHGATEAIFATIISLVDPGDEVIVFEPFYDSYVPSITMAGGVPRYYTLRAPDWAIDPTELEALFSAKTKLIIFNTPHNPTGKVFNRTELELIARLCQKYDVIAVSDEVYEYILFDGQQHQLMAQIPGMADRSITISSLGKTFSTTGWKIGWTIASPELTNAVFRSHQFITFAGAHPLQEAAAIAFDMAHTEGYFEFLREDYQEKRDFLTGALNAAGLPSIKPAGTYFVMVDISQLGFANDIEFCRYLTKEVKVAAIPPSAFYHNPADGAGIARFTFCKKMETLELAAERLAAWAAKV